MESGAQRPASSTSDSTTSNRPRAKSRASTTSIHTPVESIPHPYQHAFHPGNAQQQIPPHLGSFHYSPEEMIRRTEHQLTNPPQNYAVDPSLHTHNAASRAMSVDTAYTGGSHDVQRPPLYQSQSYDGKENANYFPTEEAKQPHGTSQLGGAKRAKGNASAQANDQELRRLFAEHRHQSLHDIATSVLLNERGPKAEKTKQVFAMIWLNTSCRRATTSVPRSRVYSKYADSCGTQRVPLLNPASFGKLVRIIFPGISTRRLGIRGESKYHYVDLDLIDGDQDDPQSPDLDATGDPGQQSFPRSHLPPDTAEFPTPSISVEPGRHQLDTSSKREAKGHLFLDRDKRSITQGPSRSNMVCRQLKFPTCSEKAFPDNAPIELPDLQNYLPPGTDHDTAKALRALYRSHCISLIDCVRYCKEKSFWHHFSSLHGTLTLPVQKLLAHQDVAPWIRECDWLMYQKLIQYVSPLALQVLPNLIISTFQSIADNLGKHIRLVFQQHPQYVQDAKLGPATIFASLLNRLLRVNAASHAAAHILSNDATRDQMWHDWILHVRPQAIAESCLPGVGYSRCVQILAGEIRALLSPLNMTDVDGIQQVYVNTVIVTDTLIDDVDEGEENSTQSVLDRWVTFLNGLPSRFPNADARTILHCVSDVSTAALRDVTMATAVSFGQWTVAKVWIDEMMLWLAEKGGFLENGPNSAEMRPKKRSADEALLDAMEHPITKPQTRSGDGGTIGGQAGGPETNEISERGPYSPPSAATFEFSYHNTPNLPEDVASGTTHTQHSSTLSQSRQPNDERGKGGPGLHGHDIEPNDDSGIGLELDTSQRQTTPRTNEYGGFIASNNNSDPADVVVC